MARGNVIDVPMLPGGGAMAELWGAWGSSESVDAAARVQRPEKGRLFAQVMVLH